MFASYVEIRSTGGVNGSPHPIGQFRLAADVVDAVHFENVRRDQNGLPRIAVGFPDLVEAARDVMARVRVFGDAEALAAVVSSVRPSDPTTAFSARYPCPVPEAHALVAYVRDRSADREFNGYSERALSRAQRKAMERLSRGEEVMKPPMDSFVRGERLAERQIASALTVRSHIRLVSRSTGQRFSLFIVPVASPNGAPDGKLDVYGLSARSATVAVPSF